MPKLPSINGNRLIEVLREIEFQVVRQKGSHVRLRHEDGRVVTVPVHGMKTVSKGLLLKILRDAKLTKDEFINLLEDD